MVISLMDIARVVSAKKLKGSGLGVGDYVLVVGTQQVPASQKDPYLLRTLVKVALVENGKAQLEEQVYLVDPRSLEKCSADEIKAITAG